MTVTEMITAAFRLAASRHPELHRKWVKISLRVGTLLPESLLLLSIQRAGELDMVLRSMEDDYSPPRDSAGESVRFPEHYLLTLSELWVGSLYEIFRLLIDRKLAPDSDAFRALAHDLRLVRIPLEKHEIAADRKLSGPLQMQKNLRNNDEIDIYEYSKTDERRAHIMPSGLSSRGSAMWHVIDVELDKTYWIERRAISERIVYLWAPSGTEPPAISPLN